VVLHDLDLLRIAVLPHKTDPTPIVAPDAVLSAPIAGKGLELIARERAEVVESLSGMQLRQLALSDPGNALKPTRRIPWNNASASRFRKDRITCSGHYG